MAAGALLRDLSQLPEQRPHIVREQLRNFHGSKVAASVELGPLPDRVLTLGERAHGQHDVVSEDGHSEWSRARLWAASPLGRFEVQS